MPRQTRRGRKGRRTGDDAGENHVERKCEDEGKFDVTGMTCSACSSRVEKCVRKLEGVKEVSVNLLTNSMQVEYDDEILKEQGIIEAVVHAGYGASPAAGSSETRGKAQNAEVKRANPVQEHLMEMKKRTIWSFVFLIP